MDLSTIKNTGNWGNSASRLNENFSKVGTEVDKLKYAAYNSKLYASEALLKQAIPSPSVGDWAIVGNAIPGEIYRCDTDGEWTATGQTGGGYGMEVTEKHVTEQYVTEVYNEYTGDIVNNPDDEDLISEELAEGGKVLKLADKAYNASAFSGLGRVYLRKNVTASKNILTQAMISNANTRYVIQYDYDLNGDTLEIPKGCVLDFQEGGSFHNGILKGKFSIQDSLNPIFENTIFEKGNTYIGCEYLRPEWFGAKGDWDWDTKTGTDDSDAFSRAFAEADNCGVRKIKLSAKCYRIVKGVDIHYGDVMLEGVFGLKRDDTTSYDHNDRNTNLYSCLIGDGAASIINILPDVSHPIQIKDVNFINLTSKSTTAIAINFNSSFWGPTWPVIIEGCFFTGFHFCFYNHSNTQYNISWLIIRNNAFTGNDWCVYFEDHSPDTNNINRNLAWAFEFYDNKAHHNACVLRVCVVKDYCNVYNNNMEGNSRKFLDGTSTDGFYSIDIQSGLKASLNIYRNHFESMSHDTIKISLVNVISARIHDNIRESDYSTYAKVVVEGVENSLRKCIKFKEIDWPIYVSSRVNIVENMTSGHLDLRMTNEATMVTVLSNIHPEINNEDTIFSFRGNSKGSIVGDKVCSSIDREDRLIYSNNFNLNSGDYIMSVGLISLSDTQATDPSIASLSNVLFINSSGKIFNQWSVGCPRGYKYAVISRKVSLGEDVGGNLLHVYSKKFTSGYRPAKYLGDVIFAVYPFTGNHNFASLNNELSFTEKIDADTDTSLATVNTVKVLPGRLVEWTGTYWKNVIPEIFFSLGKDAYSKFSSINATTVNSVTGNFTSTGSNVLGDVFKLGKIPKGIYKWKNQKLNIAEYTSEEYNSEAFSGIKYSANSVSDTFTIVDEEKYYVAYSYEPDINGNASYNNPILLY